MEVTVDAVDAVEADSAGANGNSGHRYGLTHVLTRREAKLWITLAQSLFNGMEKAKRGKEKCNGNKFIFFR